MALDLEAALPLTTLTRADEGRTIDLARGAPLRVELPEDPASGYRWILAELDSAVLAVTRFRFIAGEHCVAGPGMRVIELCVIGAGTTPLVLVLRRGWNASGPQSHFAVVVRVD